MCRVHIIQATACGHTVEEETHLCDNAKAYHNIECDSPRRIVQGRVPSKCRNCREADLDRTSMADIERIAYTSRHDAERTVERQVRDALAASKKDAPWVEPNIDAVLAASWHAFLASEMERAEAETEALLNANLKEWSERVARQPKRYYRFCVKFKCGHMVDMGESKVKIQQGDVGPADLMQDDAIECPNCQGLGGSSAGPAARWEAISRPRKKGKGSGSMTRGASRAIECKKDADEGTDLAPGSKGKGRRYLEGSSWTGTQMASTAETRSQATSSAGGLTKQIGNMALKEKKPLEHVLPTAELMRQKRLAKMVGPLNASSQTGGSVTQGKDSACVRGQQVPRLQNSISKKFQREVAPTVQSTQIPNQRGDFSTRIGNAQSRASTARPVNGAIAHIQQNSAAATHAASPSMQLGDSSSVASKKRDAPSMRSVLPPSQRSDSDLRTAHGRDNASVRGLPSPSQHGDTAKLARNLESQAASKPEDMEQNLSPEQMRQKRLTHLGVLQSTSSPRKDSVTQVVHQEQDTLSRREDSSSRRGDTWSQIDVNRVVARQTPTTQGNQTASVRSLSTPSQRADSASSVWNGRSQVGGSPSGGKDSQQSTSTKRPAEVKKPEVESKALEKVEEEDEEPEPEEPEYVRQRRLARYM